MPHIKDFQGKLVHMIGIGGSSMSGLAGMLRTTGVQVTEGSSSAGGSVNPSPTTVWNLVDGEADEADVVGDRTGVYKYWYSNTFEDANAFGYRVDINNWPQGEGYAYWTFDFYIPEGSGGISDLCSGSSARA